jgi:hypothetical protein
MKLQPASSKGKTMLRRLIIAVLSTLALLGAVWAADIGSLSTTDSSNTARFPENMPLSALNDNARALEGIIARWGRDTTDGCPATSGTNTVTVSANRVITAYYDGLTQCLRIGGANTGAATLNVDSVGAFKIVTPNNAQLSGGELQIDSRHLVQWSEAASAWKLLAQPGTGYSDPLTTNGDLLYYNSGPARLAIGSSGTILGSNGTTPFWNTIAGLFSYVFGTNPGDLIARTSTGWDVVANGTSGYKLTAQTSAAPVWVPETGADWVFTASTSVTGGTAVNFNPIPAGVNEITIRLNNVSTNTENQTLLVRIGTSGGVVSTGYDSAGWVVGTPGITTDTTGFALTFTTSYDAASVWTGTIRLTRLTGGTWSLSAQGMWVAGPVLWGGEGIKTLPSGELDRIQLTTAGGVATFDAMSAYITAR